MDNTDNTGNNDFSFWIRSEVISLIANDLDVIT
jgi:hypothetical protein